MSFSREIFLKKGRNEFCEIIDYAEKVSPCIKDDSYLICKKKDGSIIAAERRMGAWCEIDALYNCFNEIHDLINRDVVYYNSEIQDYALFHNNSPETIANRIMRHIESKYHLVPKQPNDEL